MYLPRTLISKLYLHLQRTHHPLSPPVLILVALEPDALCGCRILTHLLKRDYIPHKIQPIAGYSDLERAGHDAVRPMMTAEGGSGGVVVCLGVGGMADLGALLGLEDGEGYHGVEVWVVDARRPWNLANVFAGSPLTQQEETLVRTQAGVDGGRIERTYKPGRGGIVVFDDGDIEEDLSQEREAYLGLVDMPEVDDMSDTSSVADEPPGNKRSWSDSESDDERPSQRRRSNSSSPIPEPSPSQLRRKLLRLRRGHEEVLATYNALGASYSEPISSMMYSLASELGREDNDLLWMTIVGVTSMELYGKTAGGVGIASQSSHFSGWLGSRGARIRQLLRDEVHRLNPPEVGDGSSGVIPTSARSPNDTAIRLSPEPKFLLIRHWSLYDSMLHSPYLSARLHIWSDAGRKRLHKLLAKMGVSLVQCKQSYTHMDMELKRGLRSKLLKYSQIYGLDDLVPSQTDTYKDDWGFVRSWGWLATLSAQDVGVVVGAVLEVGKQAVTALENGSWERTDESGHQEGEEWVSRFWDAYDALENIEDLKAAVPTAQHLHRAILRTGTSLIEKKQIRHLRAFRICVVKDGPDVALFTHPSALTKLALWLGEAVAEQEREKKGKLGNAGRGTPLVVAGLHEARGVYVVVGTGGGGADFSDKEALKKRLEKRQAKAKAKEERRAAKEAAREESDDTESESESDSDSDDEETQVRGFGRNKFGNAFQEVVEETNARLRIDSFEHCVIEVKKEDLAGFLESLSMKVVVG